MVGASGSALLATRRGRQSPVWFGPGLVAAASSNDPTTVAALAVVGATTGYALCWLILLIVPALALVQALAADVGAVCQTSLQGAIRRYYGLGWAVVTLCAVAAVNTVTLAADLKAGTEALSLLTRIPAGYFVLPFVALVGWLLLSRSYRRIERYLSVLPLAFVCYAASAILAHFDVAALLHSIFVPSYTLSPAYAAGAIAILGTTLTGYVYICESIGIAERAQDRTPIRVFERDAFVSMLMVGIIFVFILVASAATLGKHHLPVETASDMAAVLVPLAGPWAGILFAIGLLASAVLAVPILASTTAYVVTHTFGCPGSLNAGRGDAKVFYGVLIGSLAIAGFVALAPVSPVAMLFWASILGGLATPVTLAFLMLIAGDAKVMGQYRMSRAVAALAWLIVGVVTAAGIAFVVSQVLR